MFRSHYNSNNAIHLNFLIIYNCHSFRVEIIKIFIPLKKSWKILPSLYCDVSWHLKEFYCKQLSSHLLPHFANECSLTVWSSLVSPDILGGRLQNLSWQVSYIILQSKITKAKFLSFKNYREKSSTVGDSVTIVLGKPKVWLKISCIWQWQCMWLVNRSCHVRAWPRLLLICKSVPAVFEKKMCP